MTRYPRTRTAFHVVFLYVFFALPALSFLCSCGGKKISYGSPPGFDFSKPVVYHLPSLLDEISGVIYYAKDNSVFAIQDEKGWLFKIHLTHPLQVERWKFSKDGDYEDLARIDSDFFVLKSKGIIERFRFVSADSMSLQAYKIPSDEKNEFETLYFDSTMQQLVAICKNCEDDNKKEVSSWAFNPKTDSFSPGYSIETSAIRKQLNEEDLKFKPSAAAINPLTGELFVLGSVNKALVIIGKDRSVKNCYNINPAIFKQPEGITFAPNGDLIISNEAGAKSSSADLVYFKYNRPKNK